MADCLLLLAVAAAYFLCSGYPDSQRSALAMFAIAVAAMLLALVMTGRAHWIAALFAAILPFLRGLLALAGNWSLIRRLLGGLGGATPGQSPGAGQTSWLKASSSECRWIMIPEINGKVLAGQYVGKMLNQLDLDDLMLLFEECREDEESVALLQAYLDAYTKQLA